jgi:hypothetical protein
MAPFGPGGISSAPALTCGKSGSYFSYGPYLILAPNSGFSSGGVSSAQALTWGKSGSYFSYGPYYIVKHDMIWKPRFGLPVFLFAIVPVSAAAVIVCVTLHHSELERVSLNELSKRGAHVTITDYGKSITFSNIAVTDNEIALLRNVSSLRALSLNDVAITNGELRGITACYDLEYVSLLSDDISDLDVEYVAELPNIATFSLKSTRVTDAVCQRLATTKSLQILNIICSGISESAVL